MADDDILTLMSILKNGHPTLCSLLTFSPYPQAFVPQLCVTAIKIAGLQIGDLDEMGQRFVDNKRIEGNLAQIVEEALRFVRSNMKTGTTIDVATGKGIEQAEYPILAIREAILNALVHRDYSIHTEGMPVQLLMFNDRLEIRNPGGLYGRISVNELGKIRSDTRNPLLATMLETLHLTENRYSGIPIMREECRKLGLREPVFKDHRGEFSVIFYNEKIGKKLELANNLSASEKALLEWCRVPRSRKEIAEHLALASVDYAFKTYAQPLIEKGLLNLTIPDKPRSSRQRYVSNIK